jgi:hypothetical protein
MCSKTLRNRISSALFVDVVSALVVVVFVVKEGYAKAIFLGFLWHRSTMRHFDDQEYKIDEDPTGVLFSTYE